MTKASSRPYNLQPNKAVDRELFLSLLARLAVKLKIEKHQYISLGGPFLEDFRLVHARLGIDDMVCVEREKEVHKRQLFNRPVNCINCIHETLEGYIEDKDFKKPVIIWFDYTAPKYIADQINKFTWAIRNVPINSVLRITLNANPSSLVTPPDLTEEELQEWRLTKFKERLGNLCPNNLKPEGMIFNNYGKSVLKALYLAVDNNRNSALDRKIVWSLATHYADGQAMVTATLVVCDAQDCTVENLVRGWSYYSDPNSPLTLDMPVLSTFERLTLEKLAKKPSKNLKKKLKFDLPKPYMGSDPLETFKKFYKVFPHFLRVDL